MADNRRMIWEGKLELFETESGYFPAEIVIGDIEISSAIAKFIGRFSEEGYLDGLDYALTGDGIDQCVRLTIEILPASEEPSA